MHAPHKRAKHLKTPTHLVGTGDDLGELIRLLFLAFDHGLEDGGVIRAEVDEAMGDAGLQNSQYSANYYGKEGFVRKDVPPIMPQRRRTKLCRP